MFIIDTSKEREKDVKKFIKLFKGSTGESNFVTYSPNTGIVNKQLKFIANAKIEELGIQNALKWAEKYLRVSNIVRSALGGMIKPTDLNELQKKLKTVLILKRYPGAKNSAIVTAKLFNLTIEQEKKLENEEKAIIAAINEFEQKTAEEIYGKH